MFITIAFDGYQYYCICCSTFVWPFRILTTLPWTSGSKPSLVLPFTSIFNQRKALSYNSNPVPSILRIHKEVACLRAWWMWHNYGISCYIAYYLWVIRQFKPSLYFNNHSCNPIHAVHLYVRLIAPALQLREMCGRVIRALRVLPVPEKITDPKKITLRKNTYFLGYLRPIFHLRRTWVPSAWQPGIDRIQFVRRVC